MKTIKVLFLGFIGFILLCVIFLRPVQIPENESDLETVNGELVSVVEGVGHDIVFRLRDDSRRYYINRGLEQGLSIKDLQTSLLNRRVTIKYPEQSSLFGGSTLHLSKLEHNGRTIFSELN